MMINCSECNLLVLRPKLKTTEEIHHPASNVFPKVKFVLPSPSKVLGLLLQEFLIHIVPAWLEDNGLGKVGRMVTALSPPWHVHQPSIHILMEKRICPGPVAFLFLLRESI